MKNICMYFQVHQPFRLRRFGFFDIGNSHSYFDEHANRALMNKIANKCYLPANRALLNLIREYGSRFKASFSISGVALDQMLLYAPETLDSFRSLRIRAALSFSRKRTRIRSRPSSSLRNSVCRCGNTRKKSNTSSDKLPACSAIRN